VGIDGREERAFNIQGILLLDNRDSIGGFTRSRS
jgi:hypothetical protein